jgi:hypothetical protein
VTSIDFRGNGFDNRFGDEGASALAEALKVNASMTGVHVGNNAIGPDVALSIANALKVNTVMTKIWFDGNTIGNEGATALAAAMKMNATLTTLGLGGCGIGDEGATVIADALKVNTSATTITLYDRILDGEFVYEIDATKIALVDDRLARNKRFRSVFLYDARRMLLSVLCSDECGVVWPYLFANREEHDFFLLNHVEYATEGVTAPENIDAIRDEFACVVEERRRQIPAGERQAAERVTRVLQSGVASISDRPRPFANFVSCVNQQLANRRPGAVAFALAE